MLKIALTLAEKDDAYQDIAVKFFEHFTQISDAINEMSSGLGLWDEQDGFYYDHLSAGTDSEALRVRSMVGLVPLMACLVLDDENVKTLPVFKKRVDWFIRNRKKASQVSDPEFIKKKIVSHQDSSKHKTTAGGLSAWPTLTPPPRFGPSVKAYFLVRQITTSVGCFWQSKNTISFIYTILNCTEEQQYIILL